MVDHENRILVAVDAVRKAVKARKLAPEKLAHLSENMNLSLDDFMRFQEIKSFAQLRGAITYEEALAIYGFLGNTPTHFNALPCAEKVALTQIFASLMGLVSTSAKG